jgi:hypothetical protein
VLKTHPYDIEAAESSLAGVDDTAWTWGASSHKLHKRGRIIKSTLK